MKLGFFERFVSFLRRKRVTPGRVLMWLVFMALAATWVLPFVWMVSTSFKPSGQVMTREVQFIPREWTLANYERVFERAMVGRWLLNSVVVTLSVTAGNVILGAMAGYALARLRFPGRNAIWFIILGSLMIPAEMIMVPRFVALLSLDLTDTYPGLILPSVASVFAVYIFRQFFLELPTDLEDAALVDGANRLQIFWRVGLPLAREAIVATSVLNFTGNWNMFVWPLLITFDEKMKTLPVGMATFAPAALGRTQIESFAPAMAAMTILGIPTLLVFLFLQRYFMQGITTTGSKG